MTKTKDLVLPPDGTIVTATTLPSDEYDLGEEEVTGTLTTTESPFGPPRNAYVDGRSVDPASVREGNAP